eukprot:SAG11_NODE_1015_length_6172_cov_13.477359_6_plen_107_part_00
MSEWRQTALEQCDPFYISAHDYAVLMSTKMRGWNRVAGFAHMAAICSSMDISIPIARLNHLQSEGCDVDTDAITFTSNAGRHLQISDILSRAVNQSMYSLEVFNSR